MKQTKIAETPMMKQYFQFKADYPEAVLLFRVGDFYETFADDAITASKVLGIVLTKRANGSGTSVPLAGFPHHSIDTYLPKLVRAGYKVAVCDQIEDPKLTKKIVKRGVTELVTPGIVLKEQLLEQKEHNYIAGIFFHKDKYGAAFLDVSTGSFQVAEGNIDYISTLISSFNPKELLIPKGYEQGVKERFGDNYYISTIDEWGFVFESSVSKLTRQLNVDTLKGFGIDKFPLGTTAAGALLIYLEQTQHSNLNNICSISRIDEGNFVWMDRFTFRNLEIFQSSIGNEGRSLIQVMDKCSSPMGARLLRTWLTMPILDTEELENRYNIIQSFMENDSSKEEIQGRIGNLGDMERIISRAAAGRIVPREVMQLLRGLKEFYPISKLCLSLEVPALVELISKLQDCDELLKSLSTKMHPEPAAAIGKGDVIATGVNNELDELRNIARHGKEILLEIQQRETEITGIPSLKIAYNSVFGYYLEVRNTHKDKVPAEWIRKQTLVNAERYITEELKEYEQKILGAQEKIYALESKIYEEIVINIQSHIGKIQTNSRIIAKVDVLVGFADLAISNNYTRPLVNDGYILDLKGARHPVIETLMPAGEEFISNDIYLDNEKQQLIILTGPNMAGKSALLRQTALIVLMAQVGSFVPASSAKIGYCDKIFTRVGASDNISKGESTFMVEMLETSMILHNLSSRSIVLLDEIGRGTSTYDGMSIARAIVEYIHENGQGAKTLFATHYHELNDLEEIYPRVENFHIAIKEVGKTVIFLRKLKKGGVAHSFGLHVARMAGMPIQVLESAEKTLKSLENTEKTTKLTGKKKNKASSTASPVQLSLFQVEDPLISALRVDLESVDINNLSPLQAFDLLRAMKEKID